MKSLHPQGALMQGFENFAAKLNVFCNCSSIIIIWICILNITDQVKKKILMVFILFFASWVYF